MQNALTFAGLVASVSGAAILTERQANTCCFGVNVSGSGINGAVGQLSDGQNRVGPAQSPSPAQYCISSGGSITDGSGRGCILTQPTTQFQCDQGASATPGFTVGSNGQITYNGSGTFYACPADSNGDYNIYTQPVANMPKCVEVTLSTQNGACAVSSATSKAPDSSPAPLPSQAASVSTKVETSPSPAVSTKPVYQTSTVISPTTKVKTTPSPVVSVSTKPVYETNTVVSATTKVETIPNPIVSTKPIYNTETAYRTVVSTSQCPAPSPAQTITETETITSTAQSQCPSPQTVTVTSVNTVVPSPSVQTSVVTPQPSVQTSVASPQPSIQSYQSSAKTSFTTSVVQLTGTKGASSPSPAPSASAPAPSGGSGGGSGSGPGSGQGSGQGHCPLNLPDSSAYQYPHIIVPVNSESPGTAAGTSYNGQVSSSVSSIFNFDIPASYAGKTCNVIFSLPTADQLTTTSFTSTPANGGTLDVSSLKSQASQGTTFANKPAVASDLGQINVTPGHAYTVASGPCAAGTTLSYEVSSVHGYALEWFQDYNACALGLYITTA